MSLWLILVIVFVLATVLWVAFNVLLLLAIGAVVMDAIRAEREE